MSPHLPTERVPLRRGLRLAVASVVLVAQVLGYAHLALVAHAVCAAHGELIDAPGSTPGHAAHADEAAEAAAPRLQLAREDRLTGAGEDQCVVSALLSASVVLRTGQGAAATRITPSRVLADAGADRAPTRLQLLLAAPKASPPA